MIEIYEHAPHPDDFGSRIAKSKRSHTEALEELRKFCEEYTRTKYKIDAEIEFEARGGYHTHICQIVAMRNTSIIVNNNPLIQFDQALCWGRSKDDTRTLIWMHPLFNKRYGEPKRYTDLIHSYPSMDVIKKIYAVPQEITNAELKDVLQTEPK